MPYLSLGPVTEALLARLNVPGFLAIAPGGATDDPPQGVAFPFVWLEVREAQNVGGLGTQPGQGARREIDLRLHAFSRSDQTVSWAQPQRVIAMALGLLFDGGPLVVTGYVCDRWQPDVRTVPLREVELQAVEVKELVTTLFFWVTEAPATQQAAAASVAFRLAGHP